jgi:hypothetical protein
VRGLLCNPNYVEAAFGGVGAIIFAIWFRDVPLFQKSYGWHVPIALGGFAGALVGYAVQFIIVRVFGLVC